MDRIQPNFKQAFTVHRAKSPRFRNTNTSSQNQPSHASLFFENVYNKTRELHWNRVRIPLGILIFNLFLIQTICTGSDSWLTMNHVHRQGIFKVCYQTSQSMECSAYHVTPGYLVPIQALMVIGVFVYIGAFVCYLFMLYSDKPLSSVVTGILALNVVLNMIGLVLFTDANRGVVMRTEMSWGWGYVVAWVGTSIAIFTAAFALLDERYKD